MIYTQTLQTSGCTYDQLTVVFQFPKMAEHGQACDVWPNLNPLADSVMISFYELLRNSE
jgi:hypothetical protein